ncbi:hypothetical protein [Anaerophaga thermohalophila]|uniref:hypothetical protein n=1 Tax=Anaerophaga thermohalophila TaxID=177400 RepID=UPI0011127151|nr:hypothetical protein [Anaerophaga thermohalophila]
MKVFPARWQSVWMLHPGHVNLHDWGQVWYDAVGWVLVDVSFKLQKSDDQRIRKFYISGIDAYRFIRLRPPVLLPETMVPERTMGLSERRGRVEKRKPVLWCLDIQYGC